TACVRSWNSSRSESSLRCVTTENSCQYRLPRRAFLRDDEVVKMVQGDMSASDVPRESVGDLSSEPAQVFGENRSVPLKFTGPLAGANIIHSIPGRVRLRVPTLKANPDLARGLQGLLSAQTGVIEVSVAPVCRSVTVVHDPARWTSESLCKLLQNLDREELD